MHQNDILRKNLSEAFIAVLDETFVNVQGVYLDKNTSLLETLETITAEEASIPVSESGASISGHIEHVRFYLSVIKDSMRGVEIGKIDWQLSWLVNSVTEAQWEELRKDLRKAYLEVRALIEGFENCEGEGDIWDSLAVISHTSYHLGAIRPALFAVRTGSFHAKPETPSMHSLMTKSRNQICQ